MLTMMMMVMMKMLLTNDDNDHDDDDDDDDDVDDVRNWLSILTAHLGQYVRGAQLDPVNVASSVSQLTCLRPFSLA